MKEKLTVLWAYITSQQEIIQSLYDKILKIEPVDDDKLVHSAYLLHNLYSAYEEIFKEISYTFENNIEGRLNFHKNLLIRLKMDIPGIRPRLLSESGYSVLGELMGFRHVFRHAYNYDLAPDKLMNIRQKVLESKTSLNQDIEEFKKFLQEHFS
jgi:hypothetical protein